MIKRKSTWKHNKLLTVGKNYFPDGGLVNWWFKDASDPNNNIATTGFKGALNSGNLNGLASAAGSMVGGAIGGGLESGAGNIISGLSGVASAIPGPWGAVAGAGLGVVGGVVNKLFGSKLNTANIATVENAIAKNNATMSNAGDFDTLASNIANSSEIAFSNKFIGKDGLFSNKAKNKAKELRKAAEIANQRMNLAFINNAEDLESDQLSGLEANYAALGGPISIFAKGGKIHIKPENKGKFTALKKRTGKSATWFKEHGTPAQKKMATFALNAKHWKHDDGGLLNKLSFGGELNAHGADFTNGMIYIDNGGSHETNPYEGVMMGVDGEGIPNLVEEGETIFNDYVFSKRLLVPKAIRNKYKLRGKKDMTFAEVSKKLAKESEERPNDPISINGLRAIMSDLALAQEMKRIKDNGNKYSHGGKLGNLYDGKGRGNQTLNYNNKTTGLYFDKKPEEFNPYDENGGINWDIMYAQSSPYAQRRQWVLDNWGSDKVNNWLDAYVNDINEYNKSRKGYEPMQKSDITKDIFENRTNDKYWGAMHQGIIAIDPNKYEQLEGTVNDDAIAAAIRMPESKIEAPELEKLPDSHTSPVSDDDLKQGKYADWLRYAPAVGFGIGAINKPDYSNADAILEATRNNNNYMPIRFNPIGNYLAYKPFDRNYYTNQLNAQSGATRRALLQNAGLNRGAGMAALLAADYNAQNQLGTLDRQAEEYNLDQRQKVEDFNRTTNITNSQGFLQADMANQDALLKLGDFNLRGTLAAAQMREAAKQRADEARSANLSGLFQTLGDIGFEEKNARMRDWAIRHGIFGPGTEDYGRFKKAKRGKIKRKKGLTI